MKKIKYFKYNEDDILEILSEHLAENNGFKTFNSKIILLGNVGNDLRLVAAISTLDDENIDGLDLEVLDEKLEYNGTHNSGYYSDSDKLFKALEEAIKKGDF